MCAFYSSSSSLSGFSVSESSERASDMRHYYDFATAGLDLSNDGTSKMHNYDKKYYIN